MPQDSQNALAKFSAVLKSKSNRALLEGALTEGLDMSRFIKCAWIQVQTSDDIAEVAQNNPTSVFRAMVQCAQMGLYPDGVTGEAYLVKFGKQCVAIRGYRGLMKLFASTPHAAMNPFVVDVIRDKDKWSLSMGGSPSLTHQPANKNRGAVTHYYAVARFADGSELPKVMSVEEVDEFKAYAKTTSFWESKHEPTKIAMRLKTVVRQLCKTLPLSSVGRAAAVAVAREDAFERGDVTVSDYMPDDHIEGGEIQKTEAISAEAATNATREQTAHERALAEVEGFKKDRAQEEQDRRRVPEREDRQPAACSHKSQVQVSVNGEDRLRCEDCHREVTTPKKAEPVPLPLEGAAKSEPDPFTVTDLE